MVVISDSCCYWIRVWTHAERRVGGRWGAGQIRQLSGKSRVKLTSSETWRHNFGGGADEWRQVERGEWTAFSPRWGEVADGESYLFYFLPQQAWRRFTYLALMLFVVARYHFSSSENAQMGKNNIPLILLTWQEKGNVNFFSSFCSQYVFIFPSQSFQMWPLSCPLGDYPHHQMRWKVICWKLISGLGNK